MRNNPGDVATWVGAVGTLLAFCAVVIPFGLAPRAERRRGLRSQSEGLAAWFAGMPQPNTFGTAVEQARSTLVLRNASPLPVYEVAVEYRTEEPRALLKPGGAVDEELFKRVLWIELLPPGEWEVRRALDPDAVTVGLSFVAAAGRYWLRNKDFRLKLLQRPPLESHGIDPSHHAQEAISRRSA